LNYGQLFVAGTVFFISLCLCLLQLVQLLPVGFLLGFGAGLVWKWQLTA